MTASRVGRSFSAHGRSTVAGCTRSQHEHTNRRCCGPAPSALQGRLRPSRCISTSTRIGSRRCRAITSHSFPPRGRPSPIRPRLGRRSSSGRRRACGADAGDRTEPLVSRLWRATQETLRRRPRSRTLDRPQRRPGSCGLLERRPGRRRRRVLCNCSAARSPRPGPCRLFTTHHHPRSSDRFGPIGPRMARSSPQTHDENGVAAMSPVTYRITG